MKPVWLILSSVFFLASVSPASPWSRQLCAEITPAAIYQCLGATDAGKKLYLAALEQEGRRDDAVFRDLAPLASQLNYGEAIPVLKKLLGNAKNLPKGYANYSGDLRITRTDLGLAARVLGEFGADNDASEVIRKYLLVLEKDNVGGSGWEEAVRALGKTGGSEAAKYNQHLIEYVLKHKDNRATFADFAARLAVENRSTSLIPLLRKFKTADREDFSGFQEALVQGSRMELGDPELRKWFRDALIPQLDALARGDARGIVFPVLHPDLYLRGLGDAEDIRLFTYFEGTGPEAKDVRQAIRRLMNQPPDWAKDMKGPFWQQMLEGLKKNTADYEDKSRTISSADRPGWDFSWGALAEHYYLLYRLGETGYGDKLRKIAAAQKDPAEPAGWIATSLSVELGLTGAGDALEKLLRAEIAGKGDNKLWELRKEVASTVAPKLANSDARWALFLFDPHPIVRDAALHQLSRLRPASACQIVTEFATKFDDQTGGEITTHALLALTTMQTACSADLVRLAKKGKPMARGIATMVLTMLGSAEAGGLREAKPADDDMKMGLDAAVNIANYLQQK